MYFNPLVKKLGKSVLDFFLSYFLYKEKIVYYHVLNAKAFIRKPRYDIRCVDCRIDKLILGPISLKAMMDLSLSNGISCF